MLLLSMLTGAARGGGWRLVCTVDDAVLAVQAYEPERGKLEPVAAEYAALLNEGQVELELSPDGHVTDFDLEGVPKVDRRGGIVHEQLRQIMLRGFAGLDLSIERTVLGAAWQQEASTITGLPGDTAILATQTLTHRVVGMSGPKATIRTDGGGGLTVGEGNAQFRTKLGSEAVFDAATGALDSRTWWVAAVPSVSAVVPDIGVAGAAPSLTADIASVEALAYLQGGQLRLLTPDEVVRLGRSGEAALDNSAATMALVAASDNVSATAAGGDRGVDFNGWFVELGTGIKTRDGFDSTFGAEVLAGGRTARGLRLGGGLRGALPTTFAVTGLTAPQPMNDLGAVVGLWWQPDWRAAPRLGATTTVDLHLYPGATPGFIVTPAVGPDAGVHVKLGQRVVVGGAARWAVDLMGASATDGALSVSPLARWSGTYGLVLAMHGGGR